jgi:hypothetical protein
MKVNCSGQESHRVLRGPGLTRARRLAQPSRNTQVMVVKAYGTPLELMEVDMPTVTGDQVRGDA